jgi:hypothetical protein
MSARSRTPSSSRAHDPDDVVALARAEHDPVAVWCPSRRSGDTVVSGEDRLRGRLRDRLKARLRDRSRFPRGFRRPAFLCCTQAVFSAGSLCDISMPGCNSHPLCRPSDVAGSLVAVSPLGASRPRLGFACGAGALLMRPLVLIPVTLTAVAVLVACRVVAGRRWLVCRSRRSRPLVLVPEPAVVIGHPVHPSLSRLLAGRCGPAAGGGRGAAQSPGAGSGATARPTGWLGARPSSCGGGF